MKTIEEYAQDILNLRKTKEERIQAAFQLENTDNEDFIRALGKGLMTDPSPIVRHEFAFSLGETGRPDIATEYLIKAVEEDENLFVRHESILALSTLGDLKFKEFIKKFLNDPEPEMAKSAEIALQRIKSTK